MALSFPYVSINFHSCSLLFADFQFPYLQTFITSSKAGSLQPAGICSRLPLSARPFHIRKTAGACHNSLSNEHDTETSGYFFHSRSQCGNGLHCVPKHSMGASIRRCPRPVPTRRGVTRADARHSFSQNCRCRGSLPGKAATPQPAAGDLSRHPASSRTVIRGTSRTQAVGGYHAQGDYGNNHLEDASITETSVGAEYNRSSVGDSPSSHSDSERAMPSATGSALAGGSVIGAMALIIGDSVGAGILAIPAETAPAVSVCAVDTCPSTTFVLLLTTTEPCVEHAVSLLETSY